MPLLLKYIKPATALLWIDYSHFVTTRFCNQLKDIGNVEVKLPGEISEHVKISR